MAAPFVARHTFSIGQHVPHAIALAAAAASGCSGGARSGSNSISDCSDRGDVPVLSTQSIAFEARWRGNLPNKRAPTIARLRRTTALHTGFLVAAQAYDMQPQHSWKRAGSCKQAWHPP